MDTKAILRFRTWPLLLLMIFVVACDNEGSDWQSAKGKKKK